ncbi:MAG: GerAB/ArcD/ProY family transporter [Limnochordales bacterium]|nr:GerAB/ArcD/ProY family transporter [Limnochordales bacterium]
MDGTGPTYITLWQLFVLAVGVLMGTSTLLPAGVPAGRDAWLAVLVALSVGLVLTALWQRLIDGVAAANRRSPPGGQEQAEKRPPAGRVWIVAFGPVVGRIVAALYFVHFVHWSAAVLRNMTTLIGLEVLPRTPTPVILVPFVGLAVWSISQGIEGTGRLAEVVIPIAFIASGLILLLALLTPGLVDMGQLLPLFERGYRPFLHGVLLAVSFPFAELVAFIPIALSLRDPSRAATPMRWAMVVTGLLLAMQEVRNIAVLGVHEAVRFLYPGLAVNELIELGRVVQRIEAIAIAVWINAGFIKLTVIMLAATSCVQEILDLRERRHLPPVIAAIGLVAGALAAGLYSTAGELALFAMDVWVVYAPLFQIAIPAIALVSLRMRQRQLQPDAGTIMAGTATPGRSGRRSGVSPGGRAGRPPYRTKR